MSTWNLDPVHSSVEFGVKHMMIATVKGRFTEFAVDADIDTNNLPASHATVRIQAASIDTRDAQRDAHLRSADFFDAENHPVITYTTKRIEPDGDEFKIIGDLTIRGTTKEVPFEAELNGPVKDPWGNDRVVVSAETKISRKDFGLNWNAALEAGGFLVGDKVTLSIDAELVKVATAPVGEETVSARA